MDSGFGRHWLGAAVLRVRPAVRRPSASDAAHIRTPCHGEVCADASNFGPNPHTGNVLGGDAVRRKFAVLEEHCVRIGRPFQSVLRTHWSPPVVLAETPRALQEKRDAISPDEHRFYGEHMVIGTPEEAIAHFQRLVEAGLRYFIVHTRADLDTARLLAERVLPALTRASSPGTPTQ